MRGALHDSAHRMTRQVGVLCQPRAGHASRDLSYDLVEQKGRTEYNYFSKTQYCVECREVEAEKWCDLPL